MSSSTALRRTPLYNVHKDMGAKLVDFHGWELPVQFTSIIREHEAVRGACGVFDVSHMGQVFVEGRQALELIQKINSNDASRLAPGRAMYSHMLNEKGGIVDDVIVSRLAEDRFFVVVNSATAEKDIAWMRANAAHMDLGVADRSAELGMLALQGPQAATVLRQILPGAEGLPRFGALEAVLYGQQVFVTRTGYTGEDGFEIAAPDVIVPRIWENIAARGASFGLLPCGLGARDTLRLEAGYLLYGSDIDEEHTPLEAGCAWVVKFEKKDFIGKKALERQKAGGLSRRLIGVRLLERGVPRAGARVFASGEPVGALCSATFSPTLQAGIGMGYLSATGLSAGDPVEVEIHGRRVGAQAAAVPFYKKKS